MKEKILAALVAISAQYNLPKDQLEKIASMAPSDLAEDKIESWAELQKPYMAMMQSYSDSRVTAQSKALEEMKKEFDAYKEAHKEISTSKNDDLDSRLAAMESKMAKTFEEKMKGYTELQTKYEELVKKQEEGDKLEQERAFSELKKRVARELRLSDKALELLEGKLSVDMDETKVNEVLSAGAKTLSELGVHSIEAGSISQDASEAAKARAKAYLDQLEKEQKAE